MRRSTSACAPRARRPRPIAAEASAVIRLHVDETGRELLSVTAQNKPGEYEVYYARRILGHERANRNCSRAST